VKEISTTWIYECRVGVRERRQIIQSEIEGGVFLSDLPRDTVLEIQTRNRCYTAVCLGENKVMISGHPEYCPQSILVTNLSSNWGGSMAKTNFVGRGMHLEFKHPVFGKQIVTSEILDVRQSSLASRATSHAV
jgi:hypothetical protein